MKRSSITRQIAAGTLTVALAVSTVFGVTAYRKAVDAVTTAVVGQLESVASARKQAILDHFGAITDHVRLIGGQARLAVAVGEVAQRQGGAGRGALDRILQEAGTAVRGIEALAVVDTEGLTLASTDPAAFGQAVDNWPEFDDSRGGLRMHGVVRNRKGEAVLLATMPLVNGDRAVGSLWVHIRPGELHDITLDHEGLGRTGETLVVRRNDDGGAQYLTPLRFDPDAALKRAVGPEETDLPAIRALQKREGVILRGARDYRGEPVIAATRYLPELDWGLVAKMNRDEVFLGVTQLRDWMLATALICILAATWISAMFAGSITRPIQALAETASGVERGDVGLRAPVLGQDEIGLMARSFNSMLDSLAETQRSLRQQEVMNRAVIETAEDGIVTIDESGRILSANPASQRIFGYEPREMIGENVTKLMPPALAQDHDGHLRRYLADGERRFLGSNRRVVGLRRDGLVFPLEVSIGEAETGERRIFVGTMRDVTERQQSEEALARRTETIALLRRTTAAANLAGTLEEALATVLSEVCAFTGCAVGHAYLLRGEDTDVMLPSGIWYLDEDRRYEVFRRETERQELAPGEDLPGRVLDGSQPLIIEDLSAWQDVPRLRLAHEAGLQGAYAFRIASAERVVGVAEFFCRGKLDLDRERLDLLATIGGQLARVAERADTLRVLQDHAAELARSNSDLEQFAYVASHDLKAPLRGVDNAIGWLAEDLEAFLNDDTRRTLDLMRSRVQRLERLLDDLLDYSRAGQGRGDGDVLNTDVLLMLQDIVDLLAPPPGFAFEVEGDMPVFWTARRQLEVVFRNLIGNAIKHKPDGNARVAIAVSEQDDVYCFTVADNGPGIDPQFRSKVFGMFQTLRRRDEVEGSGMGLAIVKKLVERQGGEIWIEDGLDGAGTAFRFTWRKGSRNARESGTRGRPTCHPRARRG